MKQRWPWTSGRSTSQTASSPLPEGGRRSAPGVNHAHALWGALLICVASSLCVGRRDGRGRWPTWLAAVLLLFAAIPASAANHAVVFVYHRFGNPAHPSTNIPVAAFEAQLNYLASHGFHVWSLPRLVRTMQAGKPVPAKTVALSVDDAYRTVYRNAWPLLREHHFPVTVFVSTRAVDRHYPDFMTWAQMREMQAQGATFADHTVTHPHLLERGISESGAAWQGHLRNEILAAQKRLQAELGPRANTAPKLFAYPYGEYSPALARMINRLGFVAFSQASGALGEPLGKRALPRFPIDTDFDSMALFERRAVSQPMPVARAIPWSPVVTRNGNPPRLVLTLVRPMHGLACYRADGTRMRIAPVSATRIVIEARRPLAEGRSLYTCTAPAPGRGYYWYTHPWFLMPSTVRR